MAKKSRKISFVKVIIDTIEIGYRYSGYCILNKNRSWRINFDYDSITHFVDLKCKNPERLIRIGKDSGLSTNQEITLQKHVFLELLRYYIAVDRVKIDAMLYVCEIEFHGRRGELFHGSCSLPDPLADDRFRAMEFALHFCILKRKSGSGIDAMCDFNQKVTGFPLFILAEFILEASIDLVANEERIAKREIHSQTREQRLLKQQSP